MKNVLLAIFAMGSLVACGGGDSTDNVASCEAFVQKVKCGSTDISTQVPCNSYANTTCDISAYFDCLSTKYVCTNGMYDPSKLATVGECVSKATCN